MAPQILVRNKNANPQQFAMLYGAPDPAGTLFVNALGIAPGTGPYVQDPAPSATFPLPTTYYAVCGMRQNQSGGHAITTQDSQVVTLSDSTLKETMAELTTFDGGVIFGTPSMSVFDSPGKFGIHSENSVLDQSKYGM